MARRTFPREWVEDPDQFDRTVTRAHWEAQVYRLARRIPGLWVILPYTGHALDMGFFSRNRAVNTASSFGVNG
jgi:hypothetical protein